MISTNHLYKTTLPKIPNVYTGKNTKELNKRQSYYKLHKKPELLKNRLPTPKNTNDLISQARSS